MTISKEKPIKAVGYVRLSTEKQAFDDVDHQKQTERIRKACERRGFTLISIYGDVGSGADPHGATRRGDLSTAVRHAQAEGAVLVIPEPTRLFRNVDAAREFLRTLDVPVFSARVGRFLKSPALLRAIQRGEDAVRAIRKGTSAALKKKQAQGMVFSDAASRQKGALKSAKVRGDKADSIVMQVVAILQRDRAYRDLSHRALADLLNRNRVLTGWGLAWTENSVRKVRKKADGVLQMIEEIDNEGDPSLGLSSAGDMRRLPSEPIAADKPGPVASSVETPTLADLAPVVMTDEERIQAELQAIPGYGAF